ncbi:MAG TPA: hypothetical protein VFJ02_01550 [Vicinamibacterales bacterium]|nr:hypothetical protein [Vicinamibacterales bacterium]
MLVFLLRLAGTITVTAFFAIFLPVDWMASTHARLGLGEFPRAPIVDYLTRTVAALYGFHGVLLLIVSTDPIRYRPIVSFVAVMNVLFGVIVLTVDLHAGLPLWWTVVEGPPIALFGVVLAMLNSTGRVNAPGGRA